jgi:hypothetical protein
MLRPSSMAFGTSYGAVSSPIGVSGTAGVRAFGLQDTDTIRVVLGRSHHMLAGTA